MPRPNRQYQPEHQDPSYFDDDAPDAFNETIHYDYIPDDVEDLIAIAEEGMCYAG